VSEMLNNRHRQRRKLCQNRSGESYEWQSVKPRRTTTGSFNNTGATLHVNEHRRCVPWLKSKVVFYPVPELQLLLYEWLNSTCILSWRESSLAKPAAAYVALDNKPCSICNHEWVMAISRILPTSFKHKHPINSRAGKAAPLASPE
jgi:hypothetical protein